MEISDDNRQRLSSGDTASSHHRRVATEERLAVSVLPDLTSRIDAMGLTQEYRAFRERYQAWRCGSSQGAAGDLQPAELARRYGGFGYWYPSKEVWAWRRTLSFWIAITFFEGSIFFTTSSFFFCYEKRFGQYTDSVTTYGYVAGKLNFLLCTYLMCVECVNLTCSGHEDDDMSPSIGGRPMGRALSVSDYLGFEWWPFNFQTSINRLQQLGAGPWPYVASVVYFIGVNVYLVGMFAEFSSLPHDVSLMIKNITFTIGSALFTVGGLAECIENEVFTKLKCRGIGWWGALLNTLGGAAFFIGSILGFSDRHYFAASFTYAIGSMIFAIGSGMLIIMWKDEQFGLTFLSALNKLGGEHGRPIILTDGEGVVVEAKTFSWRGALFIIVYILAANASTYDGFMSLADISEDSSLTDTLVRPFYAFLPCIFAHALLAINSAVVKVPADPPFRELYIFSRFLAVFMVVTSLVNLVENLQNTAGRVVVV